MRDQIAFVLALLCSGAALGAEAQVTEEFEAKILFVKLASKYEGDAHRVDPDARWVLRLQRKDGGETTYLIHSPTLKLGDSAKTAEGRIFRFRESIWKYDDGKSRRTLVRLTPESKRTP